VTASRILFVANFLGSAGLNRAYSEELSDRLEARGWGIVRTSRRRNRAARIVDMLHVAWRERHAYDIAHVDVFSGPSFVWAEAVCAELALLGKRYVLTLRGGRLPEFAARWRGRVGRLLRSAARVTVPSGFLLETMRAYRGDLELRPNAVDTSRYAFRLREQPRARMAWVRALHSIYNPTLAIDVLAQVSARHPDARLTMLGPDKDGSKQRVIDHATKLGVLDQVELVGGKPNSEVPRYLADADIFLNTTNVDNTPVSVLEAMAAGTCVVSTSVGGIPYLLKDRHDALLVKPRDPDAMTAAVESLLAVPGLGARLSTAAREVARAYDWNPTVAEWETTFREVLP